MRNRSLPVATHRDPVSEWRSNRARWDAPENAIARTLRRLRAGRAVLLDLTVSNPTAAGSWHEPHELREVLGAGAEQPYEPDAAGLRAAREHLAGSLSTNTDPVDPDDLVLCASTSEAYSWLFKITANAGHSVVTHSPSYPLIPSLAELEQLIVQEFPLLPDAGRWRLGMSELSSIVHGDTRAICVVNPNNPTGNYIEDAAAELISFAAGRRIPIISDEVFLDFCLDGRRRNSLADAREGLVFSLGGLSKMLALPHWKLAWIRIGGEPARKREARQALEWIGDTYLSPATPVQHALPRLLAMKDSVQGKLLNRLRANRSLVKERLGTLSGVEVFEPEGGWSVIVRIPAVIADEDLALRLLERRNIVVQPGYFFDLPWAASFVLSLLTPVAVMEEGLEAIAREISGIIGP